MEYEKYIIKDFNHWKLYIHKNQYYLGRAYIWAKREDAVDFIEMTPEEQTEFFEVVKLWKSALKKLFKPDLFNYAALGNIDTHLHIHLIPRYKEPRDFESTTFKDERWGKNYAPYDYDFKIDDNILEKIKVSIKNNL